MFAVSYWQNNLRKYNKTKIGDTKMPHSIGKTIKDLRHKRGFTQEELAERLGVTSQAVSKWENEIGMPDLSVIVPLSNVFGVSTDLILGRREESPGEDVKDILKRAQSKLSFPLTKECLYAKYKVILEGLDRFPGNFSLLMAAMELEISLAYPANPAYDKKNGEQLYESCLRHGEKVISYDQDVNHIMRARMIMLMLHCAYGNFTEARREAEKFPQRTDFNIHNMYAHIAHFKGDHKTEAISLQYEIMNLLSALVHSSVCLAKSYDAMGEENNAAETYKRIISVLDSVFENEVKMPFHHADGGDLYVLLAEESVKLGEYDEAFDALRRAVEYNVNEKRRLVEGDFKVISPLLSFVGKRLGDRYQDLRATFEKECFFALRSDARFAELKNRIDAKMSSKDN